MAHMHIDHRIDCISLTRMAPSNAHKLLPKVSEERQLMFWLELIKKAIPDQVEQRNLNIDLSKDIVDGLIKLKSMHINQLEQSKDEDFT